MALADLPGEFVVLTRDELVTKYKRDYLLRNPAADVQSGQPDLDARQAVDLVLPFFYNAKLIADGMNEDAATGVRLDAVGNRYGIPRPAGGAAIGYVACGALAGGGTVQADDEIENPQTRKKYKAVTTTRVNNGGFVQIVAKSVGADTNVDAGTVLRWTSPRPGIFQNATVVDQGGGVGLTGGAEPAQDPSYVAAIQEARQNPAGGDNDAELVRVVTQTPGVAVEQVFVYPAFDGPGASGYTFTVLTSRLGQTRVPSQAQLQTAFEWMRAQFPGDGSYFPLVLQSQGVALAFSISWATGGWQDAVPWPAAYANGFNVFAGGDPLSFVLLGSSGPAPSVGNTLGFWDSGAGLFRKKTISAVTGTNPYNVTCTSALGASDTLYSPLVGQRAMPWSDNLNSVQAPVLSYMATLGSGECFTLLGSFAEGRRMKRFPIAPKSWPYAIGSRVTVGIADVDVVGDVGNLLGVGSTPTVAFPPNLLELSDLSFFPA